MRDKVNGGEMDYRGPAFLMKNKEKEYPGLGPSPGPITLAINAVRAFFRRLCKT